MEGHDEAALNGAKNVLESKSLKAVVIEISTASMSILSQYGFTPCHYDPFQRRLKKLEPAHFGSFPNIIAIRDFEMVLQRLQSAPTRKFHGKLNLNPPSFSLVRLVNLTHPHTLTSTSMPRFAGMIAKGMRSRGHQVQLWSSTPKLSRLPVGSAFLRKWLGYCDQFVSYPRQLRRAVIREPNDTLFVLTDQALGMWLPQGADRPHVIHCHDFLALRSALGEFPENPTGWTGREYQRLIRNGFSQGHNFISVSHKTQADLHRFLPKPPNRSVMVYNGLNYPFRVLPEPEIVAALCDPLANHTEVPAVTDCRYNQAISPSGYIVHIGGNQWYKNRPGVLEIYRAYVTTAPAPAELWMIGAPPNAVLREQAATIAAPGVVRFLSDLANDQVNAVYSGARALLFPSLEEGFGWPIVEAMASGCPVITTDNAPMTEVAGTAARLIPRMPLGDSARSAWAHAAAKVVAEVLQQSPESRQQMIAAGLEHSAKFSTTVALDAYERFYAEVLTANCKP